MAARWLPLPAAYHPLTFFRFFAKQLAGKVHPDISRSIQQQRLSGALAVVVALFTPLGVLYALYQFSELPWVLDALLLYCSLDWALQRQKAEHLARDLQRNQLTMARGRIKNLVLRDTQAMTSMGLSKACIESLLLRSARQVIAVFFWFLCGGGLAAFGYRLLHELSQQWNVKLPRFRYFGQAASQISSLLAAPAMLISYTLLTVQSGIFKVLRQYQRQQGRYFGYLQYWLLSCGSSATGLNLGGPVFYAAEKITRCRIQRAADPAWYDIVRTLVMLNYLHLYSLMLVSSISLIQAALYIAER
ncbi:cobalamin biosynthesis protein [Chromatiaceae bacterium AAb-1]|nr:cobalamin biosynthesis protein [Chromatiaceae bacterium AAb-1]